MLLRDNYVKAFLELVRAGLWEKEAQLLPFGKVDYEKVMRLSEEQSLDGLITAGLEHVIDVKVPQDVLLQFIGCSMQIEQRNTAMNQFIEGLIINLRKVGVKPVLVKGQGVAQCYEKPLWRSSGDVDLFLDTEDYQKAKNVLSCIARSVEPEDKRRLHLGMTIDSWVVELHGTLRIGLGKRIDRIIDGIHAETFEGKKHRAWRNGDVDVQLPSLDNDVIIVFTHILEHFFQGGIGLRQICDWCRLLWAYHSELDLLLLEGRLREMGLMSEWLAFAALGVDYLGMTVGAMPMYSGEVRWKRKAQRILSLVFEAGNFGHNRDMSYRKKHSYVVMKAISLGRNTRDSMRHFVIFPLDSIRIWWKMVFGGIREVIK